MKSETININDKEHKVEDFDGVQKYYVLHIEDLDNRIRKLNFELDEMRAAREYFGQSLANSLQEQADDWSQDNTWTDTTRT